MKLNPRLARISSAWLLVRFNFFGLILILNFYFWLAIINS